MKLDAQVYDVSVNEAFSHPRRLSSGLGYSINLGYFPDGDMAQVVNLFHYRNLTEAFNSRRKSRSGTKFEVVKVNKYGNFKRRFSNFSDSIEKFVGGFRDGLMAGIRDSSLILVDLNSGSEQKIFEDSQNLIFLGSVFHKKEDLFFFAIYKNKLTYIYSSRFDGSGKRIIYKGNKIINIHDICDEGKHLFITNFGNVPKNKEPELATVSITSGKMESITLAKNKLKGCVSNLSPDGSLLTFMKKTSEIYQIFTVEWESRRTNETKKRLQESKKRQSMKKNKKSKINLKEGEEKHLKNVHQLTFGGQNAEGYFAFRENSIVFQAAGQEAYGTACDQIYHLSFDFTSDDENFLPRRLSTGLGSCTCSYLFPDDKTAIFASTFLEADLGKINDGKLGTCSEKKCQSEKSRTDPVLRRLCNTSYTWDLHPSYDIFKVDEFGNFLERLTDTPGYDAEGAISPDGKLMVFTSVRSGDPELWIYNFETEKFKQLTNELGYDGGPFFSPDGTKVGFRASRPKTPAEIEKYKKLLSYDLVEPLEMELFTINVDGTGLRQITHLGNSSWAPFYLNDNQRIVFSSNYGAEIFGTFDLYVINDDGTNLEQITYSRGFDAFPMMSRDGRHLVWGSSRNGKSMMDLNLFIAEWID